MNIKCINISILKNILILLPVFLIAVFWSFINQIFSFQRIEYFIIFVIFCWIYLVWVFVRMVLKRWKYRKMCFILLTVMGTSFVFYATWDIWSIKIERFIDSDKESTESMEILYPETVDEAADIIIEELKGRDRLTVANGTSLSKLHFGLGTFVRNKLGLWRGNDALLKSCSEDGVTSHPDYCSSVIIKEIQKKLRLHYMKMDRLRLNDEFFSPGMLKYDFKSFVWEQKSEELSDSNKQLLCAITLNDLEHVKYSLRNGASLDIRDNNGQTVLDFASVYLTFENYELFENYYETGKWEQDDD